VSDDVEDGREKANPMRPRPAKEARVVKAVETPRALPLCPLHHSIRPDDNPRHLADHAATMDSAIDSVFLWDTWILEREPLKEDGCRRIDPSWKKKTNIDATDSSEATSALCADLSSYTVTDRQTITVPLL